MTPAEEYIGKTFNLEQEPVSNKLAKTKSFGEVTIENLRTNPFLNNMRYTYAKKIKKKEILKETQMKAQKMKLGETDEKSFIRDFSSIENSVRVFPHFSNRLPVNYFFRNINNKLKKNK